MHFVVKATGFEPLIRHLCEQNAPNLDTDVVFGAKPQLVVPFERRKRGVTPAGEEPEGQWLEASDDVVLQPCT